MVSVVVVLNLNIIIRGGGGLAQVLKYWGWGLQPLGPMGSAAYVSYEILPMSLCAL